MIGGEPDMEENVQVLYDNNRIRLKCIARWAKENGLHVKFVHLKQKKVYEHFSSRYKLVISGFYDHINSHRLLDELVEVHTQGFTWKNDAEAHANGGGVTNNEVAKGRFARKS